ncbi:hypothetical protein [Pseudobacteroides cellulosolvens]|uniref:hypothetical protein n=1 Tax=Pseudobacteroides cellulosolvens TaxID=35825 RepID=UPI0012B5C625|nr:hypothetical protein [Pseudobacteroides cellulosolvens]
MRYIFIILTLIPAAYLLSFAKFTWKNNKTSSIGSVIMALMSIILPIVTTLFR